MSFINLTPHPIRIYPPYTPDIIKANEFHWIIEIPPSTDYKPARIGQISLGTVCYLDGIPVEYVEYASHGGTETTMPKKVEGTFLIVSLIVGLLLTYSKHNRDDLYVPYREVRNEQGTVIGCRELARPV